MDGLKQSNDGLDGWAAPGLAADRVMAAQCSSSSSSSDDRSAGGEGGEMHPSMGRRRSVFPLIDPSISNSIPDPHARACQDSSKPQRPTTLHCSDHIVSINAIDMIDAPQQTTAARPEGEAFSPLLCSFHRPNHQRDRASPSPCTRVAQRAPRRRRPAMRPSTVPCARGS